MPTTADTILARYATDIAFVVDGQPATTLAVLADQLEAAREALTAAQIHGAEDLDTAATYLLDAEAPNLAERAVLLDRAARYLSNVADMVDEYRLMV